MDELERYWPDPDRRDAALQRLGERLVGRQYENARRADGGRGLRRIPPRRPLDHPTDREKEVVLCLSHGLGRRGTADVLGIGLESVKTRLQNARRRCGAKDTTHLIAIAMREGWIS